jgi:hypothetical protein
MLGNYRVAAQLVASQVAISSTNLVMYFYIVLAFKEYNLKILTD